MMRKYVLCWMMLLTCCAPMFIQGFSVMTAKPSPSTSSSSSFQIKLAEFPKNLEAIQTCRAAAFDNKPMSKLLESQQRFVNATSVDKGSSECLIVYRQENDGQTTVLGTADFNQKDKNPYEYTICNVFVSPEERGQGLGRELMVGIEELLQTRGKNKTKDSISSSTTRLVLTVYTSNTPAYELYKKLGYQTKGIHKFTEKLNWNLLVEMEKEI